MPLIETRKFNQLLSPTARAPINFRRKVVHKTINALAVFTGT